ncbi:MAG TPA: carboxypeptidase regulatory-like domain-containing protein [Pyrinomonadaceae bacterium]|nr:carboxypeptidase regulatory-like domain-containing protein [Pyrinomonadaceae bacterium]
MYNSISRSLLKNLFCSAVIILALAAAAMAQALGSNRGPVGGEGSNTIQGRIYFPSNEQKGKTVKVHLESTLAISDNSASTDQDGVFRFNNLPAGTYTVVVEGGKEYETARETVTIEPIGTGKVSQVNIILRPKIDASNAAFAGVPKAALDSYQKGTAAVQKGDSKAAVQFLSAAVAAAPDFALALNDLGTQYEKQFQWTKAAETFGALVKLKPTDASAQTSLGIALYNEGSDLITQQKWDDAEKKMNACETALREAIRLKSPGPTPHYYLGLMLLKYKAYDEAQKELELAITNGGDSQAVIHRALAGTYVNTHKNKEAADELEKYLKLEPKAADAEKIKASIKDLRSKQ